MLFVITNFEHQNLCGAEEVLNKYLLLTWALACQNLQGLRVVKMANFSLGSCIDINNMHRNYQIQLPFSGYLQSKTTYTLQRSILTKHIFFQLYIINPLILFSVCNKLTKFQGSCFRVYGSPDPNVSVHVFLCVLLLHCLS